MATNLSDKLSQVKDDHAVEVVDQRAAEHEQRSQFEALFFLGRVKQNEHLAIAISTNLTAQTIRALEHFQAEGQYKSLGYTTFVDFLEKSEYSPMSKRQYYDRLALIREHGDEIFDLLTSVGISVRASKMLGKGEIAIKGDCLVVGDKEIEIKNTGVIKEVLNELFDDRRELQAQVEKQKLTNEKLTKQVQTGENENEELQRNLDAMRDGDPHDRALADAVLAMLTLQEQVGHLSEKKKAQKGGNAMRELWQHIQQTRRSYGVNFNFEDDEPTQVAGRLSDTVSKVLADDDDFGDEDEL